MSELIKVKAADDSGRVALWEVDAQHPSKEIFIAGDTVVEVFPTNAIKAAIKAGTLVEVKPEAFEHVVNTVKSVFTPLQPPVETQTPLAANAEPRQEGTKKRQGG